MTQPITNARKGKSLQWLSEEFSRLTIYRNSDFDTDELDDEELERLGGLEYRALDFLSYLVIGVRDIDFLTRIYLVINPFLCVAVLCGHSANYHFAHCTMAVHHTYL